MGRYEIEDRKGGFVVRGRPHPLDKSGQPDWLIELAYEETRWRREPVEVHLRPYCLEMASSASASQFGFFEYPQLLDKTAESLMQPWNPPLRDRDGPDESEGRLDKLKKWAIKRTAKAINKPVHAEWQRLLAWVDSTVLAVHKKVFAATWNCRRAPLISEDALYKEQYIVKDILSYPAAAIATLACDVFGPVNESPIEKMLHWRDIFAPAGMGSYHALNATLMNLPGGVPASLLCDLRNLILPRPICNRLELIATILAGARTADNFSVFAHATAAEIQEAMRRVSLSLQRAWAQRGIENHENLSSRRTRDVRTAVHYLLDYPEDHHGRILGLVDKAIRWHGVEGRQMEARKSTKRFGSDRQLTTPPIPLPEVEGIRFLATVADAVSEGQQMEHCIASYCEDAVEGRCYLFHVDYQGEQASVEVSPSGKVIQARGPRNCHNKATRWATQVLGQWGRGFRTADGALEEDRHSEDLPLPCEQGHFEHGAEMTIEDAEFICALEGLGDG